jgi:hypothetical protein
MRIEESDEHWPNAQGGIRESRESGSKVTAERDRQSKKPVRSSRDEGTKNDESNEQCVNAHSSIDEM